VYCIELLEYNRIRPNGDDGREWTKYKKKY